MQSGNSVGLCGRQIDTAPRPSRSKLAPVTVRMHIPEDADDLALVTVDKNAAAKRVGAAIEFAGERFVDQRHWSRRGGVAWTEPASLEKLETQRLKIAGGAV